MQRAGNQGFTLIEVLVAIVIFSFGLLGMVGMQAFALQANREARMQAQATSLARELAEMMRGNKQISVKPAAADNPYLGEFAAGSLTLATPSYCMNVSNASAGCTTTKDVAAAQMTDWLARVDAVLPGARVSVCLDASPYTSNGIPQWTCNATGAGEIIYIKLGWTHSSTDRSQTGASALLQTTDSDSTPGLVLPVTGGSIL
ncbi:type IV pilus modification protein PilV [Comamonas testosteroni]|uniref:Type IV pilus modification protein PilV n=1 Tax=Comamonas testosteroni TaxID=285 RepID=A0A373FLL3_COMTE|nr:type IV pilus modification protein PilV [Comamonas testosteroni]